VKQGNRLSVMPVEAGSKKILGMAGRGRRIRVLMNYFFGEQGLGLGWSFVD